MADISIRLNLDSVGYKAKPTSDEVKAIRNRLSSQRTEITISELVKAIENGQTFTRAEMSGTSSDTWQSQQILLVDIDNTPRDKTPIDHPLIPGEALKLCQSKGIEPTFIYPTFSNTPELPKFRVVFVLDEPLTDATKARELNERLTKMFNDYRDSCADTSIKDGARLVFGTKNGVTVMDGMPLTSIEALERSLPQLPTPETKKPTSINHAAPADSDELISALYAIDPARLSYDEWVHIGMALKNEGEPASIWDNWSAQDPTRYHEGECERKHNSFTGSGYTGGTIYQMAYANGWKPDRSDEIRTDYDITKLVLDKSYTAIGSNHGEEVPEADPEALAPETAETAPEEVEKDDIDDFLDIIGGERFKPIPTGLKPLDDLLDGGFMRQSLVILGAAPGQGKTMLMQQILEDMAEMSGQKVLYINLEMSREQLLARSLSRRLYQVYEKNIPPAAILKGYSWQGQQEEWIRKAATDYKEKIMAHFRYNVGADKISHIVDNKLQAILKNITNYCEAYRLAELATPLICVDYLQIIDHEERDNVEGMKKVIKSLKNIAIVYNTVVFLIMANNRESNRDGVARLESGRDTSNIEYSGDVVLGMSYTSILDHEKRKAKDLKGNDTEKLYDVNDINCLRRWAKNVGADVPAVCNRLSLEILKNRHGDTGGTVKLIRDGKHGLFTVEPTNYDITN